MLGPKLRDLSNRRVLREVGITTDRAGRRLTGIEPGEIDQGQHDGNRVVLAVSSAGMLIRRDVWDQVGGFDPHLPLFRDDIDFCWRVHAAGYEVRVVSDAVVYHRELSARQFRQMPATGGHPRLVDRRSALYIFAVNLPLWPMLAVVAGGIAGSLVRAAYFLITKQQRKAAAHLGAVAWLLRHPVLLWRARRRRAANRRQAYSVLRPLLPRSRTPSRLAEGLAGLLSRGARYESGLHHAVVDEPDDDMPLPQTDSVIRRVLTSPGVLLFAGLVIVALVAERSLTGAVLTGSGTLGGGALVPAWGSAEAMWREYLAGYHDAGIGSTASTPPYVAVVAALATVAGSKPWLAVDVLLFGCVPAAGVTAFLATRRVTPVLAARVWIAATYALLPVAMGAVAAGRIGTAVAFVLLPLIAIMIGRMCAGPPRAARRAAWAAGLLVALAAAFVPLIWPMAVLAALGVAAAWRWLGLRMVVNAVIVAAVPAAVLIPWTFHLVTSPSALFGEAGVLRPGLAAAGLRPQALLLLSPGGPGLPPVWVTAGLVLPAFCALLARRRLALVYTGWGIALTGLVIALVVSRVRLTPPQGGTAVSAWPGIAIAVAAAGLLLAAVPLIEALAQAAGLAAGRLPRPDRRALAALAGFALAASAPVLAAGYWLAAGVGGSVTAASAPILPAFVAASSAGPNQNRTLVLRGDGGALSYAVLRDSDPVLGEPELPETASSMHALASVVATLDAAGGSDAGDTGQALSAFDIGYVLLPAPIDHGLAQQLDAAAGLQPLTSSAAYDLWKVSGPVARARVITADGTVVPVASGPVGVSAAVAPATSGTLVLAEAAGGWSATLNGKPLTKLPEPAGGWAQGFVLPAGGGHLVITRDELARDLSLGAEAVILAVVFALALPGTRSSLTMPAAAEVGADGAAVPGPRRRRGLAGRPGADRPRADRPGAARRKRRPQLAPTGTSAQPVTRASGPEDTGYRPAAASGYDSAVGPFGPDTDAVFGSATDSGYAAQAAPVPAAAAAVSAAAGTGAASAPPEQVAASGSSPVLTAAPRGRGGQHAARHGKPSRRRRGSPPDQPAGPPPDRDTERHEPGGPQSRAPWEIGDDS